MTRRLRADGTAAPRRDDTHTSDIPSGASRHVDLGRTWAHLRHSEKILLGYFAWSAVTLLAVRRAQSWHAIVFDMLVFTMTAALATRHTGPLARVRDWVPLALTLPAYWHADAIGPVTFIPHFEVLLKDIDSVVRADALREWIWASGPVLPSTLELVYLVLYVVPPLAWAAVYRAATPTGFERFASTFLLSSVVAYALLPYFPAESPLAAPFQAPIGLSTPVRALNIWLLDHAGIQESLPFPSGHVAAAFGTAFGVYRARRRWRKYGACLLAYAAVLSLATVYGRYHYAAEAIAGFFISGVTTLILWCLDPSQLHGQQDGGCERRIRGRRRG